MHKDAEQLYQHADNFSTVMGFNEQNLPAVDGYVEDNQEIKLGNENIKIIHTPDMPMEAFAFIIKKINL